MKYLQDEMTVNITKRENGDTYYIWLNKSNTESGTREMTPSQLVDLRNFLTEWIENNLGETKITLKEKIHNWVLQETNFDPDGIFAGNLKKFIQSLLKQKGEACAKSAIQFMSDNFDEFTKDLLEETILYESEIEAE